MSCNSFEIWRHILHFSDQVSARRENRYILYCRKFSAFQKQPSVGVLIKRYKEVFWKYAGQLHCNFVELKLWHGCSPLNLQHIFRTPFSKNTPTSGICYRCRNLQQALYHKEIPLVVETFKVKTESLPFQNRYLKYAHSILHKRLLWFTLGLLGWQ